MTFTVQLPVEVEQRLRAKAQAQGTPVEVLAASLLTSMTEPPTFPLDDWLDNEYHAECEADEAPDVSLDEVRRILAKIPGSMTADFVAERDE